MDALLEIPEADAYAQVDDIRADLRKLVEWAKANAPTACTCSVEYTDRKLADPACRWCEMNASELWEIIMEVKP